MTSATLPTTANSREASPWLESHPFLTFHCNTDRMPPATWALLGECSSKIDHIIHVPLKPEIARELYEIFLVKGVHGTAAIEGNTLSEAEVKLRVEGHLKLPKSQAYLGQEIDNIVAAYKLIMSDLGKEHSPPLDADRLRRYNRLVLDKLQLSDEIVPGEFRAHVVGVSDYRSPEPIYTVELVNRLCVWMQSDDWSLADSLPHYVRPTLQAIIAHLYLAWIHPFGDGNGRTARLLEFDILTRAGVPPMCAHLLSDHYNRTRTEYYRALSRARRDCLEFVQYAVQGFVDGLRSQLERIGEAQRTVAWVSYVHEQFQGARHSTSTSRRRALAIMLAEQKEPVALSAIPTLMPAARYEKDPRMLERDIDDLVALKLVQRTDDARLKAMTERLRTLLPFRKDCA